MESAIFDLFAHLGATEEQLDFPVLYASARQVTPADSPAAWAMPRSSWERGLCDPSSARQRLMSRSLMSSDVAVTALCLFM